ncbi:MAG: hypothetical protein IKP49_10165 [Treponema sp.]|nr:hypothetical protein [Treponema sp.]
MKKSEISKNIWRSKVASRFQFSTFIFYLVTALLVGLFVSCDNFLHSSSDFKEKLEQDIEYAESSPYEIRVECDEGTGEITTGKILSKKITDTFDVEFKLASGAKFIGWKAYSKAADGTLTELSSDYISFNPVAEDNSGIYKTSVKFLKAATGIIIKPHSLILPAVKNYSPAASSDGSYANMPVVITFNMPMEDSETAASIFSYENISLFYGSTPMTDYFDPPAFNDDKTVLTLTPHGTELKDFIVNENKPNIDIKISFSDLISVKKEGITLNLAQNENSEITIRYKSAIEEIAPAKYEFFATRNEISIDTASSSQNNFSQEALSDFTDTQILQNRTNGTIWIYGRYYDADSGVKSVKLTEKKTNAKDGSSVVMTAKTHEFTSESDNAEFVSDGNGNITFCIKYDLESDDGAVLIGVIVLDACANAATEQTFTAIKDSGIDLSEVELYNFRSELTAGYFTYDGTETGTRIEYEDWSTFVKKVKLVALNKQIYGSCYANENDLKVTLSYNNKTENMNLNSDENLWTYDFGTTDISGLELTLSVTDDLGNMMTKGFSFPNTPVFVNIEKSGEHTYTAFFSAQGRFTRLLRAYDYKVFNGTDETSSLYLDDITGLPYDYRRCGLSAEGSLSVNIDESHLDDYTNHYTSYSNYRVVFLNGLLAGNMTQEIKFSDAKGVDNALPAVVIKTATETSSDDGESLKISGIIDTDNYDVWSIYDTIVVKFSVANADTMYTHYVDKNSTSFEFTIPFSTRTYNAPNFIKLKGINENNISPDCTYSRTEQYIGYKTDWYYLSQPSLEPEKFDKIKPTINTNEPRALSISAMYDTFDIPIRYDYMIPILATDYESQIKKVIVSINNKIWNYKNNELAVLPRDETGLSAIMWDRVDSYANYLHGTLYAIPPLWDVDQELNNLTIKFYDGYNNCREWTGTFVSAKIPSFKMQSGSLVSEEYNGNTLYKWRLGIAKLDTSNTTWSKQGEITTAPTESSGTNGGKIYTYSSSLNLPTDTFVKIFATAALEDSVLSTNFGNSAPFYYYTGTKNTGEYDYIIKNGKDKSSVLVASDAPTFVHTLVTKHSLSECEDWSVNEWEHNHKHIGDKYMDFSSNPTARKYTIPVSEIESGDSYVVIAHFADGSSAMSEVMQR